MKRGVWLDMVVDNRFGLGVMRCSIEVELDAWRVYLQGDWSFASSYFWYCEVKQVSEGHESSFPYSKCIWGETVGIQYSVLLRRQTS